MRTAIAICFLLLAGLWPLPATARGECPFLRDPAYHARVPVAAPASGELAVGTLNLFRLFDADQDAGEKTRLTAAQFSARTARIARYVARDMGAPALLAVQEVEDETALQAIAAELGRETGRDYRWLTGDRDAGSDIRNGLLYDARLRLLAHESLFAAQPYAKHPHFDRLPLVADIDAAAVAPAVGRIRLLVVHLKSQRGTEDVADAARVLAKRRFQATTLAAWTRTQAAAGARLIVLGDFNAPVLGDDPVRSEPLRILLADGGLQDVAGRFLKPTQRWTYRYRCSLQELDHLLVSPALAPAVGGYAIARGDTCLRAREKCSNEMSVSDHEGVVLRLR